MSELDILSQVTPETLKKNPRLRVLLEKYDAVRKEYMRRRCLEDVLFLASEVLGYGDLSHEIEDNHPYRIIDGMMDRKLAIYEKPFNLILIPRDCLKTTLATISKTIQRLLRNPNARILITNAIMDNARKMLSEIKLQMSENPKFVDLFGSQKGRVWTTDEIRVKGRTIMAKEDSVEIGSPDNTKTSKHYDFIVADDLVTRANITTPESKQKLFKYFQDLQDILDHPNGVIDIIGTRWDYGDMYSMIMDPENDMLDFVNVLKLGAYDENGGLMFPHKLSAKRLDMLKRTKDALEFSAQYMNDPVPSTEATFKEEYFKHRYAVEDLPKAYKRILLLDPAATKNRKSDRSAAICVDIGEDKKWYVRDMFVDKLLPGELERTFFKKMKKWDPDIVGIEEVGFQAYVRKGINEMMKETGFWKNITELKPRGRNKDDRIRGLEPVLSSGTVLFPKEKIKHINSDSQMIDMLHVLKEELMHFPNSTKRDLGDIMSFVLDVARPPKKKVKREDFTGEGNLEYIVWKKNRSRRKRKNDIKELLNV